MNRVIPPYPKRILPKSKFMQRAIKPWLLLKLTDSALGMIAEGFYKLDVAEVKLPTQRTIFPMNAADVKRVLIDESEDFPKSTLVEEALGLLIGDSIFVSNGDVWRRQRRMMTPAFEHTRVKVVFDMMKTAAASMIERLDRISDGRAYDIEEEMTFVTADIIFRTIFSRPLQIEEARVIFDAFRIYQQAAFSQGLFRILRVPKWMTYRGFRRAKVSARAIRGILDAIIKVRYDSFHAGEPQTHTDILQSLVSQKDEVTGTYFDLRELCEQVAMLFLAGHETSASALSTTLWLLTLDPDTQERMHREAVEAMGDREIEFGDLRKLNLTRNAFTEAMRLYPPVPFLPRQAKKSCPFSGKTANKDDIVSISPWLIHRHRKYWENPDAFDPDRFDRPETKEAERQCYIPFSKGPRVCLGASFALQEATIILSLLARRYRFEAVPGFKPDIVGRLTVRSTNGIWLRVSRRSEDQTA